MHRLKVSCWLAMPLLLSIGGTSHAQNRPNQNGQPVPQPSARPPAVRTTQPNRPPAPAPGLPQATSLYRGLPLPAEGELLEIPTGTVERYSVAPYRLVAAPYSTRQEYATVDIGAAADNAPVAEFPQIITVTALTQGETTIVLPLLDEKTGVPFERRMTILIIDQISPAFRDYMAATLKRVFPSVSVEIIVANGRTVLLSGFVDRAELVQPIVDFVQSALNSSPRGGTAGGPPMAAGGVQVVNALRVVGAMQVQLKVVFASVNRTKLRQLGFTFRWDDLSQPLTAFLAVQLPSGLGAASTVPFQVTRQGVYQFQGFLQALQQNGMGRILAEPTLIAMSGSPAFFNAGQQYPIVTPGGTVIGGAGNGGQTSGGSSGGVVFVPIGTNLRFVPTVLGNGRIRLEVRPEVSEFVRDIATPGGGVAPVINQRVTETTVEMESGQTFVLAGLTRQQVSVSVDKIPIIGDLPLVGWAFQQKTYNQQEEELVIMVTPYFADALNERPCKLPGRESRIPNDLELYLGSKFEPPCFDDPYVGDWKKGWVPPVVTAVPPYDNYGRPEASFVYPQAGVQQMVHTAPAPVPPAKGPGTPLPPMNRMPPTAPGVDPSKASAPPAKIMIPVSRPAPKSDAQPLGSALWKQAAPPASLANPVDSGSVKGSTQKGREGEVQRTGKIVSVGSKDVPASSTTVQPKSASEVSGKTDAGSTWTPIKAD